MLNNVVNRYLAKTARITEQKVFIEGYRPSWPATKDAFALITVKGNTFPLKDALLRAGLRWNPSMKEWSLGVSSQADGFRKYDLIAPKVDKAFDVLEPIVRKFNKEVEERNKAVQPTRPQTMQEVLQHVESIERRNKFFAAAGLDLKTTNKGPFAPEMSIYVVGNTYPLLAVFKKFGWKWWNEQKAWVLPFDDWKAIERQFLAVIAPQIARMAPAQPAAPTTFPWSNGKVWLENTGLEDEAEDTGVEFTPLGPDYVAVKTTYMYESYEKPPKRYKNIEALEIWDRLTKHSDQYQPRR